MDTSEIVAWTREVAHRAKTGGQLEDRRVELKREWPQPLVGSHTKAALQLADRPGRAPARRALPATTPTPTRPVGRQRAAVLTRHRRRDGRESRQSERAGPHGWLWGQKAAEGFGDVGVEHSHIRTVEETVPAGLIDTSTCNTFFNALRARDRLLGGQKLIMWRTFDSQQITCGGARPGRSGIRV